MIRLKDAAALAILRQGGQRLAAILGELARAVAPGITTGSLDELARRLVAAAGDEPAFLNYRPAGALKPYPAALCVSVNDEVVHGIPGQKVLRAGDLVSLDLGLKHQGLFTDMAISLSVGSAKPEVTRLLEATRQALAAGIAVVRPGGKIGDVGAAIVQIARRRGYRVVSELGGHGVGYQVHEPPPVPNLGRRGTGSRLEPGLVLAIEPMLTIGQAGVSYDTDGYTVRTTDGSWSAHFEQTVAVTETGAEILTPWPAPGASL